MGASFCFDAEKHCLYCEGKCTVDSVEQQQAQLAAVEIGKIDSLEINGEKLTKLDTVGAWLLIEFEARCKPTAVYFSSFSDAHQCLLDLVRKQHQQVAAFSPPERVFWVAKLGKLAVQIVNQSISFLSFIGETAQIGFACLLQPLRIPWKGWIAIIESAGFYALPITGLLAFLIGVVLAYQMGLQLRNYGANIYIVNLIGLAVLREFSPLITAIIVAGRSGSAFTAQLGTMKVNEEMDALRTMGVSPIERLVLPRILGLVFLMPLLTIWSDIMGVLGGMVMSYHMLDIHFTDFILRFKEVMSLKTLLIGVLKAPVFAMIIASIGCFQGFQVTGSAESVGRLTTQSVVQAIFAIICVDALFSILLSWYGL